MDPIWLFGKIAKKDKEKTKNWIPTAFLVSRA